MADETKIIRIVIDSSAAVDGSRKATAALEKMERAIGSSGGTLSRMEASLGRIGGLAKANLALALADVGTRLLTMGKQAFDAAAGLGELADQLGITTRGLQALQFSAAQNGTKLEQLETGVSKFSQKMGEAAGGSKEMIEALDRIGVKILDTQGKLRPTEDIMQNVAAAIMKIDDPARRSAAAVDFFGKAGTKLLPMLPEIAGGFAEMGAKAQQAGAMISQEAIEKLDKLADRGEKTKLVMRSLFAEAMAGPLTDALDLVNSKVLNLINYLKQAKESTVALLAFSVNPGGAIVNALTKQSPAEKLGSDIDKLNKSIAEREAALGRFGPGDWRHKQYTEQQLAKERAQLDALQRQKGVAEVGGRVAGGGEYRSGFDARDPDNIGVLVPPRSAAGGASNPAVAGAGASEADAVAKAMRAAQLEADAQTAFAEASERGARAVESLEIHFKALKAAQDAYGKTADANKAGVAALTAELEKMMTAADRAKNLKDFNLGTEGLERTNELLEAENRLINASTEDRARELALIRTRQEVLSKGLDESNSKEREAIERRNAAIEQNERLKAQGEELKKANEIWTAPLKSALESIQRTGADMFEQLLENGKFSAEEFGQIFAKMARRAAAELLALATIRPVINVAMQAVGSLGLVSPGTASALGYPAGGGSIGGLGGGSLFGGGGLFGGGMSTGGGSGWLGNIGSWLNSPIAGSWSGISNLPAGMYGPAPNTTGGLGLSGTTWGQGLGAAAGAGMGIYQLATSRSTGQTIGGIASLVGAGVSLIPGIGQIAGPLISLAGSLLPSLFGENKEPPTMRGIGTLDFSGGAWRSTGAGYGGGQAIDLAPVGKSISGLLQGAGVNLGGLTGAYGLQQQTYSKGDFSNATVFVNGKQWGQGSNERDIGMDHAIATIAHQMMMEVGSGISQTMREGMSTFGLQGRDHIISTQELAKAISEISSFEAAVKSLAKSAEGAEAALASIDQQFAGLYDTASRYGLSTGDLDAAKNKARLRIGTDFADSISRQLMGDKEGALYDLGKERDSLLRDNTALLKVSGYLDQAAKIEELYGKKRAAIIEQYARQATDSLQALIDRLTYGDLGNASPTTSYSGQRANYLATLAQARGGDSAAAGRLAGVAEAYANAGRSYFGSSADYAAIAEQIRRDLVERQAAANAGSDPTGQAAQISALMKAVASATSRAEASDQKVDALVEQIAALTAQLQRRA